ncbi:VRR-NUC domain-containing protein, partial [Vibrio parahaemolyticus]|nr:VRR-NUC domain-containing protein [Vibrio parahaemolyticus]
VTWYSDLLTDEEQSLLCSFDYLNKHAQCILVRLYSRKGCWFRSYKLNYLEIPLIDSALAELGGQDLISLSPALTHRV